MSSEELEAADKATLAAFYAAGDYNSGEKKGDMAVLIALDWLQGRAPEWTSERRVRAAVSLSGLVMNGRRGLDEWAGM